MRAYEKAKASRLYDVSETQEMEWLIPKQEHTFMGPEDNFRERPTYIKCLNCQRVVRYASWEQFSMTHGEMCRERAC